MVALQHHRGHAGCLRSFGQLQISVAPRDDIGGPMNVEIHCAPKFQLVLRRYRLSPHFREFFTHPGGRRHGQRNPEGRGLKSVWRSWPDHKDLKIALWQPLWPRLRRRLKDASFERTVRTPIARVLVAGGDLARRPRRGMLFHVAPSPHARESGPGSQQGDQGHRIRGERASTTG